LFGHTNRKVSWPASKKRQGLREAINLDLLVVGFREAPEVFRRICAPRRPVDDVFLWYSVLSDIEGMEESDLVVNWRGERSHGWGGWAEKGGDVELLGRYAFAGVFLDKIRFPSPANGIDEALSCFCDHCRRAAKAVDLDLDAAATSLASHGWTRSRP
jgi:hypothetical protein